MVTRTGVSSFVSGSDKKGRQGLYLVDVQTGDATTSCSTCTQHLYAGGSVVGGRESRSSLYEWRQSKRILRMRDVETGKERELSQSCISGLLKEVQLSSRWETNCVLVLVIKLRKTVGHKGYDHWRRRATKLLCC